MLNWIRNVRYKWILVPCIILFYAANIALIVTWVVALGGTLLNFLDMESWQQALSDSTVLTGNMLVAFRICEIVIIASYVLFWLAMTGWMMKKSYQDKRNTILWPILVFVLHFIGVIVYLVSGSSHSSARV